jgi:hypothetical protein
MKVSKKAAGANEIQAQGRARVQVVAICICGFIAASVVVGWIFLVIRRDPYSRDLLPIIASAVSLFAGVAMGKSLR